MKVKDIMITKVITVPERATLLETAKILSEHNVSGAPITNAQGILIGIISEKDIFKALYPSHAEFYDSPGVWIDLDQLEERTVEAADKPIVDLMTREVVTVNPDASLMQVGSIMLVRGIHRVVVVGQDNTILGIVTRKDIYHNILKNRLNI
ncbi:MAG: CBS domain-containing protein [Candidatus Kerfeldbacteria bacterium]|nr:CBS domain-containing protein [Candidatus Kerfeldbacteria bacterium]